MKIEDRSASLPTDDTIIWRYMDLERFVIMLVSGALRFTKANEFKDDPWEGFCKVVLPRTSLPELRPGVPTELTIQQSFAHMAKIVSDYLTEARHLLHVSSWSVCADSMAMWKIYGSSGRGLAIISSSERLRKALRLDLSEPHYQFDRVTYVEDIENSPIIVKDLSSRYSLPLPGDSLWPEVLATGYVKRSAYQHEMEWRAAIYQDIREDKGIDVPCSLDLLIDRIVLGPNAPDFMVDVVRDLIDKFCLTKHVSKSTLLSPPRRPMET